MDDGNEGMDVDGDGGGGEPPSIPEGARLQFVNIFRAEVAKDDDDKPFSVFFLEVHCKTASPSQWTVYRRYTQFRQLNDLLRSEGYFVPVLPPKKIIGQFNADFVKQRKIDLETWLYHLAEQHGIHTGAKDPQTNAFYRSFLTDNANMMPASLEPRSAGGGAAGGGGRPAPVKVSLDDFDLVKVIGKGSFGKVTLVRKKSDGLLFAMKVLSKPNIVKRKQVEHTKTERRVLGKMKHPFIVHMYYAFQTEQKLYFVLDYAAGGELFYHLSRMKKFTEQITRFFCAEITMALDALHNIGVVYRDLKPENILLDTQGHIKLADFGLAKEGVNDAAAGAHSMCGTPEYLSPEVLNRMGHGTSVDWWNLGMVSTAHLHSRC
jgi:serum/glucocorticoid-regulated kinase 3